MDDRVGAVDRQTGARRARAALSAVIARMRQPAVDRSQRIVRCGSETSALTTTRSESASGYTLIELLVVLSIIVILASMGLAQYRNSIVHAREATLREDLFRMRDAIDQYYADKGQYPTTIDALATDGYLRSIPKDPITQSTTTWVSVPAEPSATNPSAEPGVFDVKSGSDAVAIDGSKYAEW